MDWFSGSVADAVRIVKEQSKTLLVFVKGADGLSKSVEDYFNTPDVALVCKAFICLCLDSNSEACSQFSAVYVVLSTPCVYLIQPSGKVIDCKMVYANSDELISWLQIKGLGECESGKPQCEQPTSSTVADIVPETTSTPVTTNVGENEVTTTVSPPSPSTEPQLPLEDRVKRAYELIEQKRAEKLTNEASKVIDEESKRREAGKRLQEFKERQQEQEVREALAQRRRDTVEDREYKERLKKQIEEDRREKNERYQKMISLTSGPSSVLQIRSSPASISPPPRSSSIDYDQVRLQLRFIGGGSLIGRFTPSSTLAGELRNWLHELAENDDQIVDNNVRLKLVELVTRGYRIRQLHPPRLFEPEDETKSMAELGLCPSAVLMLVTNGGSITPAAQGGLAGYVSQLFYLLTSGAQTTYDYVGWIIGGVYSIGANLLTSLNPMASQQQASANPQSPTSNQPSDIRSVPADRRENRAVRRQGNMARLSHFPDNSDDEQARWNGNSTSQL